MDIIELYNYIRDIYRNKYAQYVIEIDLHNSINLYYQLDLLYQILREIRDRYVDYGPP